MGKHSTKDSKITDKSEKEPFGNLEVSVSFVAKLFGKTERTVTDWCNKRGCPKLGHGRFDLRAVLDWWIENIFESAAEVGDESIQEAKRRYWAARASHEEIRVKEAEGSVVEVSEIKDAWATRARELAVSLNFLENRLATRGSMKPTEELRSIVRSETRQMRAAYCREGRFCTWDGD